MQNSSVPDTSGAIFFVKPQTGRYADQKSKFDDGKSIPAKVLFLNGKPVVDPDKNGSNQVHFYTRRNADGSVDESSLVTNPHNYLIVPANYDPSEAVDFANKVRADMGRASGLIPGAGLVSGLRDMTENFVPGGGQDLQRGAKWGVPKGDTSPAFKDAASWNLGFITQLTPIPNVFAKIGGGAVNLDGFAEDVQKKGMHFSERDLSGPFFMDKNDALNFVSGARGARDMLRSGLLAGHTSVMAIGKGAGVSVAPGAPAGKGRRVPFHMDPASGASVTPVQDGSRRTDSAPPHGSQAGTQHAISGIQNVRGTDVGKQPSWVFPESRLVAGRSALGLSKSRASASSSKFSGTFPERVPGKNGYAQSGPSKFGQEIFRLAPVIQHENNMPSLAPVRRPQDDIMNSSGPISGDMGRSGFDAFGDSASLASAPVKRNDGQAQLARAVRDLFEREAMLPPAGMTGFDPFLTPAWPGLQLPG